MDDEDSPQNPKVVKLALGVMGVLCIAVSGAMFFMGQTGKETSSTDDRAFFAILLVVGIGCLIALDLYSAKVDKPARRVVPLDDADLAPPPPPPEPEEEPAAEEEPAQPPPPPAPKKPEGKPEAKAPVKKG
ncbi:MAG: hypothetical protein HQL51_10625 [Magnetococcales bacterium]|nr:hypothetical protein [Magnetococcales bacterium]